MTAQDTDIAIRRLLVALDVLPMRDFSTAFDLTPAGLFIVSASGERTRIPYNAPGSPETYATRIASFIKQAERLTSQREAA